VLFSFFASSFRYFLTKLIPLNKNRKVSAGKNVSLVLFLDGFQVVRMMELLGLLGCVDYIRGQGGIGGSIQITKYKTTSYTRYDCFTFI